MTTTYRDRDGVTLEYNGALTRPIGSEFTIEFSSGKRSVAVRVVRTKDDEWLAFRQFGAQGYVTRLSDGRFDPRQAGHTLQPTLHEAIKAKLGPF